MQAAATAWQELRALARLALPIVLVQVGMVSLNAVDVAMLGHFDAAGLSAMTLGNILAWAVAVFCMGVLFATDPLFSQAVGAGDEGAVRRTLLRGTVLAALLSVPAGLLLLPAATWLHWFGQPAEVIPGAAAYARIQALGVLPFLWFSVFRQALSAHSVLWPVVLVIAICNGANALLDWMWIYGRLGFDSHGVHGAAWATVACRWLMVALLVLFAARHLLPRLGAFLHAPTRAAALRLSGLLRLLRLGTPIGLQHSLEMGIFAATGLMMGWIGTVEVAGHQIAINLASLSFMIPVGLSIAASVRVGWSIGRGDGDGVRRAARVALASAIAVMACFAVLFLAAPELLAAAFTDDPPTAAMAALLLPVAAVFQVFDGLQVVAIGVLRGTGDTRTPMVVNVLGFWLLGLPTGYLLAFAAGLGPAGLWWGLVAGLLAVAGILLAMVRRRLGQDLQRLALD